MARTRFPMPSTKDASGLDVSDHDLPAPVVAETLGIHVWTAVKWSEYARRDWIGYLAARADDGRPSTGEGDELRTPAGTGTSQMSLMPSQFVVAVSGVVRGERGQYKPVDGDPARAGTAATAPVARVPRLSTDTGTRAARAGQG